MASPTTRLTPPSRTVSAPPVTCRAMERSPPFGRAPSAATMMDERLPRARRASMAATIEANRKGISGIRITSPPAAMPACRAIQPASRPMTSTSITRWWLAAVVWIRSIASVAMPTAVSKPKVRSVPSRSLSIVFGTPTIRIPWIARRCAMSRVPSPPTTTSASMPAERMFWCTRAVTSPGGSSPIHRNGSSRLDVPRIVPPMGRMPETDPGPRGM